MDRRIKRNMNAMVITVLLVVFIATTSTMSPNYFATAILAYGKLNQVNSSITEGSLDIYNIPLKKVHVVDIDITYKIFGKGNNIIILINGAGENMNFWDPHFLRELSANNSVIVFDNRGIGSTTLGNKPFTINQLYYSRLHGLRNHHNCLFSKGSKLFCYFDYLVHDSRSYDLHGKDYLSDVY